MSKKPPDDEDIETLFKEEPKLGLRTLRRLENSNYNEYVIKMSLVASLHHLFKNTPEAKLFVLDLQNRSTEASKASHRLSLAYNIIVKDSLENNKIVPDILDSTFARQIMLGQQSCTKPIEYVKEFLLKYDSLLPEKPKRFEGDRNTYVRIAEQYITNCKNYLNTTFESFQFKFICNWTRINKIEGLNGVIKGLINYNKYTYRDYGILSDNVKTFIFEQRTLLGLLGSDTIKNIGIYISKNFNKILKYYNYMSCYLIKNELKGLRTLPINKIKNTFIHVDTDVIKYMFELEKHHKININTLWDEVFNTRKYLTKSQQENSFHFTKTIQTDGSSICIHYRRPKIIKEKLTNDKVLQKELLTRKDTDRLLYNDSGRVNMIYCIEETKNGIKKYVLTRKEYYQKAGMTNANRKREYWSNVEGGVKDALVALSKCNTRTTSLKEFLVYLKTVKEHYNTLWSEYTQKKWSKLRFSLYSGKQRTFAEFFSKIKGSDKRNTKFICGDGGFASSAKNELSCPTTRVIKEAKKYFKILYIDEFRTSMIHNETLTQMKKVGYKMNERLMNKENERRNPKYQLTLESIKKTIRNIRGLYCHDSDKGSKLVNRDFNAAKNIGMLYRMYPERPNIFKRSTKKNSALPILKTKIVNQI